MLIKEMTKKNENVNKNNRNKEIKVLIKEIDFY